MTGAEKLQEAYFRLKAGDRTRARILLMEVLDQSPDEAEAWVGLSFCATSLADRRRCLERALTLQPGHQYAQAALARLAAAPQPHAIPATSTTGGAWDLKRVNLVLSMIALVVVGLVVVTLLIGQPSSSSASQVAVKEGQYQFIEFYADW